MAWKTLIEGDARRQVGVQRLLAGGQGLERDADIMVASGLVAGQGARIATNVRQMRRQPG